MGPEVSPGRAAAAGVLGTEAAAGPPPPARAESAVLAAAGCSGGGDAGPLHHCPPGALCPRSRPDGHRLAAARSPRRHRTAGAALIGAARSPALSAWLRSAVRPPCPQRSSAPQDARRAGSPQLRQDLGARDRGPRSRGERGSHARRPERPGSPRDLLAPCEMSSDGSSRTAPFGARRPRGILACGHIHHCREDAVPCRGSPSAAQLTVVIVHVSFLAWVSPHTHWIPHAHPGGPRGLLISHDLVQPRAAMPESAALTASRPPRCPPLLDWSPARDLLCLDDPVKAQGQTRLHWELLEVRTSATNVGGHQLAHSRCFPGHTVKL
ncbi:uncharacterized protein LOC133761197 [Lepus europaeus]|uniref:uncharacterized protein LOC133761197 n=1 Tax=Lepus europaeus TaxID=9983 RepID=UPI002B45ED9A|nr:uncharacterized protein LOC133761197 [Lepus europaeus]